MKDESGAEFNKLTDAVADPFINNGILLLTSSCLVAAFLGTNSGTAGDKSYV